MVRIIIDLEFINTAITNFTSVAETAIAATITTTTTTKTNNNNNNNNNNEAATTKTTITTARTTTTATITTTKKNYNSNNYNSNNSNNNNSNINSNNVKNNNNNDAMTTTCQRHPALSLQGGSTRGNRTYDFQVKSESSTSVPPSQASGQTTAP
ncbi:hypothetical protein PoB_001131300 [Plakobranchus ocellatus]|uniref:Uncharacterized protein n=1 Tax=Plakobranchus ocellatus TaxID=259542 RepID=A0AAV3YR37_9GAST|nr:hypothetical protein PoB_001131300 [Plakobranchus ocellatus]